MRNLIRCELKDTPELRLEPVVGLGRYTDFPAYAELYGAHFASITKLV